jgi:6-phosphogluconolactonase (cycloisomerase 2 family)
VSGSPFNGGAQPEALVVDPASRFVFVAGIGVSVFTIDNVTGNLAQLPGSPFSIPCPQVPGYSSSLAIDASGKFLYVTNTCPIAGGPINTNLWGLTKNPNTGALTLLPADPFLSAGVNGPVEVTVRGQVLYVSNGTDTTSMFTIDEMTADLTHISDVPIMIGSNHNLYNITFAP